jgi:MFS family permease
MMVLDSFRASPRAFRVLMASALIENVAFGIIVPYLAIYMVGTLHISKPLTGVALAGYTLSGIPGTIIGGMLTDKIGRRYVLLASLGLMSLTMLMYFFAVDFVTLFIIVLADSFVGSLYMPAANAMIADVIPKEGRPKAYSTLRIAWNIGMFLGPALGIFIVTAFSVRELFIFGSVILVAAFALNIAYIPETKPKDAEEQEVTFVKFFQVSRNRTFLMLCAMTAVMWFSFSQWMGVLLIYATSNLGLSISSASLMFMINGGMVVTLQLWVTSKMIKFRRSLILMAGQLIVAGGFSLIFFANDILSLIACIVTITIGELVYMSIVSAIIADMSPDAERGIYMGFSGFIQNLGIGAGFFVGMWLLDVLAEPRYIWFIFGMITVIGSFGYLLLGRMLGPERDLPKYQPEIIPLGTPPLEK